MKHLLTLCLCMTLLLCGCGKKNQTDISLEGSDDIDAQFIYAITNETLYRYDVLNRKATIACDDPLCKHDSRDCYARKVYGSVARCNGCIYTVQAHPMENEEPGRVIEYNPKTGKSKIVYEDTEKKEDGIPSFGGVAGKYLFIANEQWYSNEKEEWCNSASLYRLDTETGKVVQMNKEPMTECVNLEWVLDDGSLFWGEIGGSEKMFTTDINFENRKELTEVPKLAIGNYYYDEIYLMDSRGSPLSYEPTSALKITDKTAGESKMAIEKDAYSIREEPECILYMLAPADEDKRRVIGLHQYGSKYYDYSDNVIHCMDPDGSNPRVLCTLPDDVYGVTFGGSSTFAANSNRTGDYIAIHMYDYIKDENNVVLNCNESNQVLMLNIKDGSYFMLNPEV